MRKLGLAMAGGIAAAIVAVATGPAPAQSTAAPGVGTNGRAGRALGVKTRGGQKAIDGSDAVERMLDGAGRSVARFKV